jgi:hypothetical protein
MLTKDAPEICYNIDERIQCESELSNSCPLPYGTVSIFVLNMTNKTCVESLLCSLSTCRSSEEEQ